MACISLVNNNCASGYCTLTATTSSPSPVLVLPRRSVARCTCPIEALPNGIGSNVAKVSSNFLPVSSSIVRLTTSEERGGISFSSVRNSRIQASPKVFVNPAAVCPYLEYIPWSCPNFSTVTLAYCSSNASHSCSCCSSTCSFCASLLELLIDEKYLCLYSNNRY